MQASRTAVSVSLFPLRAATCGSVRPCASLLCNASFSASVSCSRKDCKGDGFAGPATGTNQCTLKMVRASKVILSQPRAEQNPLFETRKIAMSDGGTEEVNERTKLRGTAPAWQWIPMATKPRVQVCGVSKLRHARKLPVVVR